MFERIKHWSSETTFYSFAWRMREWEKRLREERGFFDEIDWLREREKKKKGKRERWIFIGF